MKKQIIFINRPHSPRTLSQQEPMQQFRDDLARLREKYGDSDQVITLIKAAEEMAKKNSRDNTE